MQENYQTLACAAIARLIKGRRGIAKLSQAELAKKAGLKRDVLNNLESGRQDVYLDQIWELARAMGVAASDLLPEPADMDGKDLRSLSPGSLFLNHLALASEISDEGPKKEGTYLPSNDKQSLRKKPRRRKTS